MEHLPKHINDELLVKYLLGEATPEEQQQVEGWISRSEENQRHFDHFKLIWDQSKEIAAKSTVDTDEAWARFRQRTEREATPARVIELPARRFEWRRAAAIVLIVIMSGAGYYLFNQWSGADMIALHSENNVLIDTLSDGSVVTLNKNATLYYPKNFKGDLRNVKLEGEAFFDVAPDKSKPFVIDVNDVSVTVVGTSFNIKSTTERTEVIVETGIVEVAKKEHMVQLRPEEKAIVLKDDVAPVKQRNTDELYNYYRTREFVCNATPLWRLADVLTQAYNVEIVIGNERIRNLPLTATFQNESLDSILKIVSETLNVQVERKNGNIILN